MNIFLGIVASSVQANRIPVTVVLTQSSDSFFYNVSGFNLFGSNIFTNTESSIYLVSAFNLFGSNIITNTETVLYSVSAISLSA